MLYNKLTKFRKQECLLRAIEGLLSANLCDTVLKNHTLSETKLVSGTYSDGKNKETIYIFP